RKVSRYAALSATLHRALERSSTVIDETRQDGAANRASHPYARRQTAPDSNHRLRRSPGHRLSFTAPPIAAQFTTFGVN
ncbi:MAG TPA: hypothetical protein VHJ55_03525, partial [Casimicrobiaceae bacterium]|nr:hypothetical protein [Casimicrobiaceae bacterium]